MALETASAEHICNVIRRQIQNEFPDLTVAYILYNKENQVIPPKTKRSEVESHPAWPVIAKALPGANPDETICMLAKAREKGFLHSLARKKTLACVLFPQKETHKDPDYMRQQALALAWHALNAQPPGDDIFTPGFEDDITRVWNMMLADAFAALVIEMQGKRGFIKALARRQSELTLSTNAGYVSENFAYPLIMDAAQLVYDDARRAGTLSKTMIYTQALEMTHEIGLTFDQGTVLQWWAFARPAQEWPGCMLTVIKFWPPPFTPAKAPMRVQPLIHSQKCWMLIQIRRLITGFIILSPIMMRQSAITKKSAAN